MKKLILTIATLALSTSVAFGSGSQSSVPGSQGSVPGSQGSVPGLVADLTWLNVGYAGGPNVVGDVAVAGSLQFAAGNNQTAWSHTDDVNTVENPELFVKGAEEQHPDFVAGTITTSAQNVINSTALSADAYGRRNVLAGALNVQGALGNTQYAHAGVEGTPATEGGWEHSYDTGPEYVWVDGTPEVRVVAGDVTTSALNFINVSTMDVDADQGSRRLRRRHRHHRSGDVLAIGANVQFGGRNTQAAVAHIDLVESYGNVETVAGNVLNESVMTVDAGKARYHGSSTAAGLNLQGARYNDQFASARASDVMLHGGNLSTIALNSINTLDMKVTGMDLSVGLSAQKAINNHQYAGALTNNVGTWGGSITTTAGNTINSGAISATTGSYSPAP